MAARKPRIVIPRNPDELIKLLKLVLDKHAADGASSALKDVEMSPLGAMTATADKENKDGEAFRKKAETCTELRDQALGLHTKSIEAGTALFILLKVRDTLAARFKGQEQKLGDWGFTVDASPKAKKDKGGAEKSK